MNSARRIIEGGISALILGLPLHAFLTTALSNSVGHAVLIHAWKEILIVFLAIVSLRAVGSAKEWIKLLREPHNLYLVIFAMIAVFASLASGNFGTTGWWFGVKISLSFGIIFLIGQLISGNDRARLLAARLLTIAGVVAVISLLQRYLLPDNILSYFGYGPNTIEPIQYITGGISSRRIFSTFSGPNQLGAFLILPISLLTAEMLRRFKPWHAPVMAVLVGSLWLTYSRSALLGTLLSAGVIAVLLAGKRLKKIVLVGAIAAVSLGVVVGMTAGSDIVKRYAFHKYESSQGSDDKRLLSWTAGFSEITNRPFGRGLGGSTLQSDSPLVSENYFLQTAIETGILGFVAFTTWQLAVGRRLWQLRQSVTLAVPLLGSLAGISFVCLFLHGWSDSSLSLVYWSLAGVTIGTKP